jgi:hypothetical protein
MSAFEAVQPVAVQLGDKVRFRQGRGYAIGQVVSIDGQIAVLEYRGKPVRRQVALLDRVAEKEGSEGE